jgi:chromosomal replication initiator protein
MTMTQELAKIDLSRIHIKRGVHQIISPPAVLVPQFVIGAENAAVEDLFSGLSIESLVEKSPIVLFGPNSSGKTTLAHELLWRWARDQTNRKLTLTSGNEFGRALQRGTKADDMARFRQIHRQCDGLLIDNLHEMITKPAAQSELVILLKEAYEASRLVVITSLELPRLRPDYHPSLQSLLSAGLSVPVKLPGPQARFAITEMLASQIASELTTDELNKFCMRIQDNPSALELRGLLNRWAHQLHAEAMLKSPSPKSGLQKNSANKTSATKHIDKIVAGSGRKFNCKDLLKIVAKEFQVTLDTLTGPSRKSGVVRARGLAMLLMRQLTDESFEAIGEHFSGRDHTTVMHACKRTESSLAKDSELNRIYDRIRQV